MSKNRSPEKNKARRLDRLIARAGLVLAWERVWPCVAAALTVVGAFVAASWLGLWMESPRWLRVSGSILFGAFFLASFAPLILRPRASRRERLARLDRDSGLKHRPASSLDDQLANSAGDPATTALWALHQRRLEQHAAALKLAPPSPRLAERDRYALRAGALVALAAAAFVAGPEKYPRILAAFDWRTVGAPSSGFRLDAWIDPPPYTGRPPLLLTGAETNASSGDASGKRRSVRAPVGSVVIVRTTGVGGLSIDVSGGLKTPDPKKPAPGTAATAPLPVSAEQSPSSASSSERRWTLQGDAKLVLRRYGSTIAQFDLSSIPDKPPTIALVGQPKSNARGSLTLDYKIDDDYGVIGAEARFADPLIGGQRPKGRSLVGPPKIALSLPSGQGGLGQGESTADLSEHPWAGARVTMTLSAKDEGGNEGLSDPVQITLPQRTFTKPMARALVEQRRNLALDPERADRVAIAINALMIAPEQFDVGASIYLGLTAISDRLAAARNDADLLSVTDLMWEMALRIEDGDGSQAERDLRAAQQNLRDALQHGASDQDLRKLMDQLRASLDKFLQALAQQQARDGNRQAQANPNQRAITQRDLQSMLDRMENMARSGDMADAQRMLNQLQNLMENLQTARRGPQNPMTQEMNRALNELDQMTRDQQQLRDKTFQHNQEADGDQSQQNPGPADRSGKNPGSANPSAEDLQRQQQALRQRLDALQRQMKQLGLDAKQGLGDAEEAMRDAEQDLGQGKGGQGDAVDAQGRALQALRRGAESLAQQMQQNGVGVGEMAGQGQPGNDPMRQGSDNSDVDPLGREAHDPRYNSFSRYDPLGAPAAQRAQQVLQELRRRLGNPDRPQEELDYFDRLLHPY